MKKLFIIRHGKSDWSDPSLEDFDRPLNKRGLKNSSFMGKVLRKDEVVPDLILSSPAKRAYTTAKLIAKEIKYKEKIVLDKDIYEADYQTLVDILREVNDKNKTVFIVGHNPGFSDLADFLCGLDKDIPTCAIVEIEFNTRSWENISIDNASLISYDYPKKHKED